MKRIAAAAIFVTLLTVAPPASANHYAGWHWRRTSNPFTVTLVESITSKWKAPLENAANEWSTSSKFDFAFVPGNTSATARRSCAETQARVHVCTANYGAVGWAGLTELTLNGHHIVKVRVRLNDYYVTSRGLRRLVSCHELGHTVGLAHRSESSSCMKQGMTRAHPDAHDYQEINIIYKHLDGATALTADANARTIKIYDWATPQ
jgi:hypothetical protein